MDRQEFFSLIDKWIDGSASDAEVQSLMNYYHSFHAPADWDESQLGAKALLADEMEQQVLTAIRSATPAVVPVKRIPWLKIAAAVLLLLAVGSGWWYRAQVLPPTHTVSSKIFVTKAGEHQKMKLPDGTTVWLSPASSLQYADTFFKGSREVVLSGEAFFEVVQSPQQPFIIHSDKVATRVLGTSFNIQAFAVQPDVAVTVLTGKVAVAAGAGEAVPVAPQQRAVFSKSTGIITKEENVSTAELLNRREGILKYNRASLAEVATQLGYYYNVTIEIAGNTSNCFYFGEFNTHGTLEKALQQLCLTLNATLEKNGTKYIIRKSGEC